MADALTQAYDAAAAAGGPEAMAVYQLGKELGAKPSGTVVTYEGYPAQYLADRRLALELLDGLAQAGLVRVLEPTSEKGTRIVLRPSLFEWLRPELLLFVGGWLKSRKPQPSSGELLKAAQYLAGDVVGDGQRDHVRAGDGEGPLPPTVIVLQLFLHALRVREPRFGARQGGLLGGVRPRPVEKVKPRVGLWVLGVPVAIAALDWLVRRVR